VKVELPGGISARSPSGLSVAVALSEFPELELCDMAAGRCRHVAFGGDGPVNGLAWLRGGRLAVTTGERPVVRVIDARTGASLQRARLDGRLERVAAAGGGAVVLLSPARRIGAVRLAIARPGTAVRTVALPSVRAGMENRGRDETQPDVRIVNPAVAVDEGGRAAYVFTADASAVVRVDLRTVAVRSHPLSRIASAAKAAHMREAYALWLGGGRVAVSSTRASRAGRQSPAGTWIVDTRTWRARRVDDGGAFLVRVPGGFAVGGRRGGVAVHDSGGALRFARRFGGRLPLDVQVAGNRIWVQKFGRSGRLGTWLLDARTGRTLLRGIGDPPAFVPPG
jgi:hypothetical protein